MRNYNRTPETDFEKLHAAVEHLQDALQLLVHDFDGPYVRKSRIMIDKAGKILDELRLSEKQ